MDRNPLRWRVQMAEHKGMEFIYGWMLEYRRTKDTVRSTGYFVYANGQLHVPSTLMFMQFDTPEEAMAYAEATFQLELSDG